MFHVNSLNNSLNVKYTVWCSQGSERSRLGNLGTSASTFEFYASQASVVYPKFVDVDYTSYYNYIIQLNSTENEKYECKWVRLWFYEN